MIFTFPCRLDVLQRRMVKFVLSRDMMYHVSYSDLRQLSWFSVSDRVRYFKLTMVFKVKKGFAPTYISESFQTVASRHSYCTRGSFCDYSVSKELANSPHSFTFTAIKFWNELPMSLKQLDTLPNFRKRLKDHLFSSY